MIADPGHRQIREHRVVGPQSVESARAPRGLDEGAVTALRGDFSFRSGVELAETLLAGPDRPTAIVCANDDMAFGAIEALSDAGKTNVPIIGFDALPEALQDIQAGTQAATVEQFPGGQSTQAIDIALAKLIDGKDPAQHDTYLTPILITKDNLADAERAVETGVATPVASPTS